MPRQPLTEKSDSNSTVRLVQNDPFLLPTAQRSSASSFSSFEERRNRFEQPGPSSSSVFPTLPSQILPPPSSPRVYQGYSALLPASEDDEVSDITRTTRPTGSSITHQPPSNSASPSGGPKTPRLKHVKAVSGGKFAIFETPSEDSGTHSSRPPFSKLSSYPTQKENDSPTKSPISSTEPRPVTPTQTGKAFIPEDNTTTSTDTKDPELVGGLRIVPKTPDSKKETESPVTPESVPPLPLAPKFSSEEASAASTSQQILTAKLSNISTTSENPSDSDNYVVYENNSSSEAGTVVRHPISHSNSASSSQNSNFEVYGAPSIAPTDSHNSNFEVYGTPSIAPTESHNSNYEVYDTSLYGASASSSSAALIPNPSQDSLAVPALRSKKTRSHERLGYYKSRSRESLRTPPSLVSISSVLTQEATRAVFGSASVVNNLPPPSSFAIPGSWAEQALSRRQHMQAHPHQWSSQLSTVLSESGSATDRGSGNLSSGRRSSGFLSSGSRQYRGSGGSFNSLERPQPAFARNGRRDTGSTVRMVGDQDEHGDHLTDMRDSRLRSSRSRSGLSFFSSSSSDNGRRNSVQSSTSSRANSLLINTIPAWARVYYGSGERRWLPGAPGSSTEGSDSRPSTPMTHSGSPVTDNFPLSIYSPRRRPRETNPSRNPLSPLRRSLEIAPAPQFDSRGNLIQDAPYARQSRRWRTSSIWSPHLRVDRRAARMSAWQPPSFSWSTENRWTGRRNVQVVMFVFGFIFPFAWMIAALLPLPPNPVFVMQERQGSEFEVEWSPSYPDLASTAAQEFRPVDEARYESAKWWRRVNRFMSLVGLLIIGTIIALVILGVRDWSKN